MTPRLRAEQAAARIYGLLIERALRTNTGPVTVGDLADLLTREFEAAAAPLPSESEDAREVPPERAEPGPCSTPTPKPPGLNGAESVYDHDAPAFCVCGWRMDSHGEPSCTCPSADCAAHPGGPCHCAKCRPSPEEARSGHRIDCPCCTSVPGAAPATTTREPCRRCHAVPHYEDNCPLPRDGKGDATP